jgi:NitT/TauT family transport system substrate-binding protein
MIKSLLLAAAVAGIYANLAPSPAEAADKVRLVISTRMPFELFAPEQAAEEGYFKAENLDVEIIYASGGAETIQSLATGSQDVAVGVGTESVLTAYSKGASLAILGNGRRGTGEIIWYVPKDSPIKSIKDLTGKELAFSRPGSTTHTIGKYLLRETGVNAKLVSVGGISAARTQVMSGQIATGWSAAPVMLNEVRTGNVRIIASGADVKALADWSIRVTAANGDWVANKPDVAKRFMRAFWKGVKFNYEGGERAIKRYADKWKLEVEDAKRGPEFTPLKDVTITPINLDGVMELAVEEKMMAAPLKANQLKKLVRVVYDPAKDK